MNHRQIAVSITLVITVLLSLGVGHFIGNHNGYTRGFIEGHSDGVDSGTALVHNAQALRDTQHNKLLRERKEADHVIFRTNSRMVCWDRNTLPWLGDSVNDVEVPVYDLRKGHYLPREDGLMASCDQAVCCARFQENGRYNVTLHNGKSGDKAEYAEIGPACVNGKNPFCSDDLYGYWAANFVSYRGRVYPSYDRHLHPDPLLDPTPTSPSRKRSEY